MNENVLYQILTIINHNGNIWELIDDGYEFGQVSSFIDYLKSEKYIVACEDGRTILSEAGIAFIKGFEANNGIRNYSKWILPRKEMWHAPLSKSYIYIPKW